MSWIQAIANTKPQDEQEKAELEAYEAEMDAIVVEVEDIEEEVEKIEEAAAERLSQQFGLTIEKAHSVLRTLEDLVENHRPLPTFSSEERKEAFLKEVDFILNEKSRLFSQLR